MNPFVRMFLVVLALAAIAACASSSDPFPEHWRMEGEKEHRQWLELVKRGF